MRMAERANSKADQVYEAVKEAILSGELEPGAAIDKLALVRAARRVAFPVSAAISRLAFERLVRVEPQHGSFVARISVEDVREHLFIRRALEGEIAAEAARRLDDEARADARRNLDEAEAAAHGGRRAAILRARRRLSRAADASTRPASQRGHLDGLRAHLERRAGC